MKVIFSFLKVTLIIAIIIIVKMTPASAQGFNSVTNLNNLTVSAITGEKPQSKVWNYAGKWWMVMPNSSGTQIWRLDGTSWTSVLTLSPSTSAFADCKVVDNVTHILLYQGTSSSLVSVEYVPASTTYQLWTTRTSTASVSLDSGVETASIDIDGNGRMWIANAGTSDVNVRWSDSPYSTWSSPITVATGVNDDDICVVTALPGKIGVLWSNQNTQRFGFKYHADGADPSVWSSDEVPASQSALAIGGGMGDDHLNIKVGTDGTLYAAVKTSYNDGSTGNPQIALLIRRPGGTWDNLYEVSTTGTRSIVVLNETAGKVKVIYTSSESGGNILYRESPTSAISFGSVNTLISGTYNNATSTKQNYSGEIVIMASSASTLVSVLAADANPNLVAHWKMDESTGATTISDASTYVNNGSLFGSPSFVSGMIGNTVQLNGTNQYATAANNTSLDISGAGASSSLTLSAWVKPNGSSATTQNIIKKAVTTGTAINGYELSLASAGSTWPQKVFFRLNQGTSADTYRVNSATVYPLNGSAWMHIAATFDGTTMKLYVNGIQEGGDLAGPVGGILSNTLAVGIGAQPDGTTLFYGLLDDVRIYNRALSASEIQALILPPSAPALSSPANLSSGISISPVLSWSASSGAASYRVQVSTTSDFSTTVVDQSGITSTSASVISLLNSTTYYWRVNASNSQGNSSWSPIWSFTTLVAMPSVMNNGAGFSLDFDGIDDYVNCGNNPSVQIAGNTITMESWIKPTKVGTMAIIKKTGIITGGTGYELYCGSAGKVYCRFNGNDASRAVSTTSYPTDGTWMHVAATYDGISTKIYINGVLEGTTAFTAPIVNSANILEIGNDPSTGARFFQGAIDEVRLWNVARTDDDIKGSMTRKLAGTESGLVGYWRFDETSGTIMNDETSNNNDGTLIAMDPSTDHVWSSAPLGSASSYDYNSTGGYTATLNHSNGDALTATTTAGTIAGLQIYRADDNALRFGSTGIIGYTLDPSRFWGVKAIGTATPTYTLVYNYNGNPIVTNETLLRLVKRNSISVDAWTDAMAILDTSANTLTVTGATGTEYALANSTQTPPAAPTSLNSTVISASQINLSWTDNSNNETGFQIERSSTGISGPYTLHASKGADTTTFSDLNLASDKEYCYRVRAVNPAGNSAYTNSSCATTLTHPGFGLNFDGTNDYVTFGAATSTLGALTFTLECWFNWNGSGATASTGTGGLTTVIPLITKGRGEADGSNLDCNYFLGIQGGKLAADFEDIDAATIDGDAAGMNHPILGTISITPNVWHHAAVTYDGAVWKLYVDGILDNSLVLTKPGYAPPRPQYNSIQHAGIGSAMNSTGVAAGFFAGKIDEVRIWNYSRTELEIQNSINLWQNNALPVPTPTGLIGRWGMNEGSGTSAVNSVVYAPMVNGTLTNGPAYVTPGAPFNLTFVPPIAPTNLIVTPISGTILQLSWTDNANNESGFEIEKSTTGPDGPFSPAGNVNANILIFNHTGLDPLTNYCYRVRAVSGNLKSAYTSPSCGSTLSTSSVNYALDLGSNGSYVTFGVAPVVATPTFTVETWFKRNGIGIANTTGSGGIDIIPLISKGSPEAEGSTVDENFILGIQSNTNVIAADFEEGTGSASPGLNHPVTGTTVITDNVWHHAAVTFSNGEFKVYLDGNLENTLNLGASVFPQGASVQHAALGTMITSTGTANGRFNGVIDEARIWNYSKTLSEIRSSINSQIDTSQTGLLARWGLNEGAGTIIISSAGTSVDGTVTGTGYTWVPGAPFNLLNFSPNAPVLNSPLMADTGVSIPVMLNVGVSDPDSNNLTVHYYGRPALSTASKFSVVVLPDAQYYTSAKSGGTPAMFTSQTQWCVDNKATKNIVYVSQVGDVTDENSTAAWVNANTAMSLLDATPPGIPYGIVLGNHDYVNPPSLYDNYFPISRFQGRPYYGGHYGTNNENHFDFFSSEGMEFIVLNLSSSNTTPATTILNWADSLLKTYSTKRGILVNHYITETGNPAAFSAPGNAIYTALKDNPNLFLMLCGHVPGVGRRSDVFNGSTIYSLLADYQGETNGGNGYMRIMEFDPSNNQIHVTTYSPYLNQWKTDAANQFDLPYLMDPNSFQLIGTNTGVPSGANTTKAWTGLLPSTAYEWYVTVDDGISTVTSPVWNFTTGNGAQLLDLGPCSKTDVDCYGASTGSVSAGAVSNALGIVHYNWKNSSNISVGQTSTVLNLPAGEYRLIISDDVATDSCSVTINQPAAPLAIGSCSKTDVNCFGGSNGSVIAGVVTNSVGAVNYSWENESNTVVGTTSTLNGLPVGTYTLTVTDQCGSVNCIVNISGPTAPIEFTEYHSICQGDTYSWHGQNLDSAGIYNANYISQNGCDSIYALYLTINPTYSFVEYHSICQGDIYIWHGQNLTADGTYNANYTSQYGCDSSYTLNLMVNPVYNFNESYTICQGETYTWHGQVLDTIGTYYANYLSQSDCDSVYRLTLSENPAYYFNENHKICDGDTYSWQGQSLTTTGVYTANYQTILGCDTTYSLNLSVNPVYDFIDYHSICQGEIYQWQGNQYDTAGTYTANYSSRLGCDSTYTLILTLNPSYSFSESYSICQGNSYTWHGQILTSTGIYTASYQTLYGCDSLFTLNLTVNPAYNSVEHHGICIGDTYSWHGQLLSTAGTYTDNHTSLYGCDSTFTLYLTVNPPYRNLKVKAFIESFYLGGGLMSQAKGQSGPQFGNNIADKISVALYSSSDLNNIAYETSNIDLNTNGTMVMTSIPCNIGGNYYIVLKHRNSIEIWSSEPLNIGAADTANYDFTISASQTYGNNAKLMGSAWVIFSGDATQDGAVDGSDMASIDNASTILLSGYNPEDINGDGIVDGSDMAIIDNNATAIIQVMKP